MEPITTTQGDSVSQVIKNKVEGLPPLLTERQLEIVFANSLNSGTALVLRHKNFKLNDFKDLQLARNIESELNDWLKETDAIRVEFKAPYLTATKAIDGKPKPVIKDVEKLLTQIKNSRIIFQQVNRDLLKAKIEKIETAIINENAENFQGRLYVQRIIRLMMARLIGGTYLTAKEEPRQSEGCKTAEEVLELIAYVQNGAKTEKMLVYEPVFLTFLNLWVDSATIYAKHLDKDPENIQVNAKTILESLENGVFVISNRLDDFISEKYQEELSMYRVNMVKSSTGVRKTLTFDVLDIKQIPYEYLTVDEAKVKELMKEKEEEIRAGAQPIPGLNFRMNESAVTR